MTRPAEAGFSLVEVLVAFAILAMALVTGFQIFGGGVRAIVRAGDSAAVLEDAILALETTAITGPGELRVEIAGRRSFRLRVSPVPGRVDGWLDVRPYRVQVFGDDGRDTLVLDTIRIARVEE